MSYIEKPGDIVYDVEVLAEQEPDTLVVEFFHYAKLYEEYLKLISYTQDFGS